MKLTIYNENVDKVFQVEVSCDETLKYLKEYCCGKLETGDIKKMKISKDGDELLGDGKKLEEFKISNDEFLTIEIKENAVESSSLSTDAAATIDFSNIKVNTLNIW